MQPNPIANDAPVHPLDPRRIGPNGLEANLCLLFQAAVADLDLVSFESALALAKCSRRRRSSPSVHAVRPASDRVTRHSKRSDNDVHRQ